MKNIVELSIIIPIYNMQEYLAECLQSVLAIKNICTQIICIDDASTDSSRKILSKFDRFDNLEILANTKNIGLAATRNVGLKHAKGKYIMFVDSDDRINSNVIDSFVDRMDKYDLDALYFDVEEFSELLSSITNNRKRKHCYNISEGLIIFDLMVKNREMFGTVFGAIYKKEFIYNNQLWFIDGILHEDIPFSFNVLNKASKVSVINEVGYFYRQRNGSILHQPNYLERAEGLIIGYSKMITIWKDSYKKDILFAESSIDLYLNSIISMIEENLKMAPKEDFINYPIVRHFVKSFNINKYIIYQSIFRKDTIKSLQNFKKIAFYGAGKIAEELIIFLTDKDVRIDVVFVTKLNNNKKKLNGIDILQYSRENSSDYDAIILAVASETQKEIDDYIKELGYKGMILKYPL